MQNGLLVFLVQMLDLYNPVEHENYYLGWVNFQRRLTLFGAMRMGLLIFEVKGLEKEHVFDDHIEIVTTISRGVEKRTGKRKYRRRVIPLTIRLKDLVNQAMQRSDSEYVFTMEDGGILNYTTIREDIWLKALAEAGFRTGQCTRTSVLGIGGFPLPVVGGRADNYERLAS